MKKIWYLLMIGLMIFGLWGCWGNETAEKELQGSGEMLSWASFLTWTIAELSWAEASHLTGMQTISGTQLSWMQTTVTTTLFPVELCNKIISFNRCIISKAPIENQAVMKQQLLKVIEPWKGVPNIQLQEICYRITQEENFQEVLSHYAEQGCLF